MTIDQIKIDEKSAHRFQANIECPVLRENLANFFENHLHNSELTTALFSQDNLRLEETFREAFAKTPNLLGLYTDLADKLVQDFHFTADERDHIVPLLETLAATYVGTSQAPALKSEMKKAKTYFVKLDHDLERVIGRIEEHFSEIEILMSIMFLEPAETKRYLGNLEKLIEARNALHGLADFVRQSPILKICEVDKPARPTNWALFIWTEAIYILWLGLGRTISNQNDGINGRKHLLDFLEFCIRPVHEAVEYETLDNMLRRVQKSVAEGGGLSHPDFELGSSSPLRVSWRNTES